MLETLQKVSPPDNGTMGDTGSQSAGNTVSWLAGFIDGEGSIGFDKTSKKDFHYPHVIITSTHKPTIERVVEILSAIGVQCWVTKHTVKNPKHKQDWNVIIRGLKRVKPLLDIIIPHLFTKREQAQAILDFTNYRLSLPSHTPYGGKEKSIIARLHQLNHRGPSETTRAPQTN